MKRLFTSMLTLSCCCAGFAQTNDLHDIIKTVTGNSFVIIGQEYQLIDNETDEAQNAPGKDYWARTYSLATRVGDNSYLVETEGVRPWSKDTSVKGDRLRPEVTITQMRSLSDPEFEIISFDPAETSEIVENRLYTMTGSEEVGMTVKGLSGQLNGFLVTISSRKPLEDNYTSTDYEVSVTRKPIHFAENKVAYDLDVVNDANLWGGIYVMPLYVRPGLVEFCITGVIQKIGGRWKLVSIPANFEMTGSESEINSSAPSFISQVSGCMPADFERFLQCSTVI